MKAGAGTGSFLCIYLAGILIYTVFYESEAKHGKSEGIFQQFYQNPQK